MCADGHEQPEPRVEILQSFLEHIVQWRPRQGVKGELNATADVKMMPVTFDILLICYKPWPQVHQFSNPLKETPGLLTRMKPSGTDMPVVSLPEIVWFKQLPSSMNMKIIFPSKQPQAVSYYISDFGLLFWQFGMKSKAEKIFSTVSEH